MTRRVTTAPEAVDALLAAFTWLTQPGSGAKGHGRWAALSAVPERLSEYPYIGPRDPDRPGRYRIVVAGYRVIDRVDPDTGDSDTAGDIRIVALFGPGQR